MRYDKNDRQAIKSLSGPSSALFEVIEKEEKGNIINVPGICEALRGDPRFVVFSCIYGDGKRESLENNLGMVFATKLKENMENFIGKLKVADPRTELFVIVDDTEPVRSWG